MSGGHSQLIFFFFYHYDFTDSELPSWSGPLRYVWDLFSGSEYLWQVKDQREMSFSFPPLPQSYNNYEPSPWTAEEKRVRTLMSPQTIVPVKLLGGRQGRGQGWLSI